MYWHFLQCVITHTNSTLTLSVTSARLIGLSLFSALLQHVSLVYPYSQRYFSTSHWFILILSVTSARLFGLSLFSALLQHVSLVYPYSQRYFSTSHWFILILSVTSARLIGLRLCGKKELTQRPHLAHHTLLFLRSLLMRSVT